MKLEHTRVCYTATKQRGKYSTRKCSTQFSIQTKRRDQGKEATGGRVWRTKKNALPILIFSNDPAFGLFGLCVELCSNSNNTKRRTGHRNATRTFTQSAAENGSWCYMPGRSFFSSSFLSMPFGRVAVWQITYQLIGACISYRLIRFWVNKRIW